MTYPYLSIVLTIAVSVLPSLFALEIRAALKRGGRSFGRFAFTIAEDRLAVLNSVRGNAYEFILWLCWELRQPLYETAILILLVFMIRLRGSVLWTIPASIMLGGWIGTLVRIFGMIGRLRAYESSRIKLERQIEKLKVRSTAA